MNSHRMLFTSLVAITALGLSACAEETSETATETSGDETGNDEGQSGGSTELLSVTETGWLTVGTDGAVQTTFFDAGGRYRDLRNGAPLAEGSWEQRPDGAICFEPDAGLGACWETSDLDENGSAIATNGDGKKVEIKRVTYIAPNVPDDAEAGESEDAS